MVIKKYSQILPTKVNGLTDDIIEGALIKSNDELENATRRNLLCQFVSL